MDASPTPSQTLRLLVEIDHSPDARLVGRLRQDATVPWRPFSGVLELLKVLEEVVESAFAEPSVFDESSNPKKGTK